MLSWQFYMLIYNNIISSSDSCLAIAERQELYTEVLYYLNFKIYYSMAMQRSKNSNT